MAHFNQCSQLINGVEKATDVYVDTKLNGEDPLNVMLAMQQSLQTRLSNDKPYIPNPQKLETAGDVLRWMQYQDDCIADETRELYTSLGGMSNGEKTASGIWKKWKANHLDLQNVKISDLSPEDQLEIKFELVDQWHFFMCKFLALGMDAQEIFELYYLKNKENFERQDNGY